MFKHPRGIGVWVLGDPSKVRAVPHELKVIGMVFQQLLFQIQLTFFSGENMEVLETGAVSKLDMKID